MTADQAAGPASSFGRSAAGVATPAPVPIPTQPASSPPDSPAPAAVAVVRVELSAENTAPKRARRHVRAVLTRWGSDQDTLDAAELAVTELVTNAVLHTGNEPHDAEPVILTLRRSELSLVIEVWDHDQHPPVARRSGPNATNGRGMAVVAAVSTRWSWFATPPVGKVVWCELRLDTTGPLTTSG